jgi:hypothetical protein
MKLTNAEQVLLQDMKNGLILNYGCKGDAKYYYREEWQAKRVTREANGLLKKGLIKKNYFSGFYNLSAV